MDDLLQLLTNHSSFLSATASDVSCHIEFLTNSKREPEELARFLYDISLKDIPGWEINSSNKISLKQSGYDWIKQVCCMLTIINCDVLPFIQRLANLLDNDQMKTISEYATQGIQNGSVRVHIHNTLNNLRLILNSVADGSTEYDLDSLLKEVSKSSDVPFHPLIYVSRLMDNQEKKLLMQITQDLKPEDVPGLVHSTSGRPELSDTSAAWLQSIIERLIRSNLPLTAVLQRMIGTFSASIQKVFTTGFCQKLNDELLPNYSELKDGLLFCMQSFGFNDALKSSHTSSSASAEIDHPSEFILLCSTTVDRKCARNYPDVHSLPAKIKALETVTMPDIEKSCSIKRPFLLEGRNDVDGKFLSRTSATRHTLKENGHFKKSSLLELEPNFKETASHHSFSSSSFDDSHLTNNDQGRKNIDQVKKNRRRPLLDTSIYKTENERSSERPFRSSVESHNKYEIRDRKKIAKPYHFDTGDKIGLAQSQKIEHLTASLNNTDEKMVAAPSVNSPAYSVIKRKVLFDAPFQSALLNNSNGAMMGQFSGGKTTPKKPSLLGDFKPEPRSFLPRYNGPVSSFTLDDKITVKCEKH